MRPNLVKLVDVWVVVDVVDHGFAKERLILWSEHAADVSEYTGSNFYTVSKQKAVVVGGYHYLLGKQLTTKEDERRRALQKLTPRERELLGIKE